MVPSGIMKGWAMCTCGSIPPGMMILPPASTTRVASPSASVPGAATAAIVSPLMARSHRATPCGVTTSPPRMIRSSMCAPFVGLARKSAPTLRPGKGPALAEPLGARRAGVRPYARDVASTADGAEGSDPIAARLAYVRYIRRAPATAGRAAHDTGGQGRSCGRQEAREAHHHRDPRVEEDRGEDGVHVGARLHERQVGGDGGRGCGSGR